MLNVINNQKNYQREPREKTKLSFKMIIKKKTDKMIKKLSTTPTKKLLIL
ncbi:MAG: hypothetical protein AB2N28_1260 [Candidatus Phytoplasma solani]